MHFNLEVFSWKCSCSVTSEGGRMLVPVARLDCHIDS